MLREILTTIKENILLYVKHRLFPFTLLILVMFGVLISRLFQLQIVEGEEHLNNFTYKIQRGLTIDASRGNIYDRNGNLLAYNKLVYCVTFGNSSELARYAEQNDLSENSLKNDIVYQTIQILEKNGDSIVNNFSIAMDKRGNLEFTVEDNAKKRFLMDVYAVSSVDDLSEKQVNATAEQVFAYIAGEKMFEISDAYDKEDALKIMAIRYSLWLNRYQQYVPVTIALDISKESMAQIQENEDVLYGIDVVVDSIRQYNDATYMAHIIGYIGNVSSDEMAEKNVNLEEDNHYSNTDMIGKTGLEKVLEDQLRGTKGTQVMYVDNLGRVLETTDTIDAVPGTDFYLTIDLELQKYCYQTLEKELASIIVSNMTTGKNKKTEKDKVIIPEYSVYFALFNNNLIDIDHMASAEASDNEKTVYNRITNEVDAAVSWLNQELMTGSTLIKDHSETKKNYLGYVYDYLSDSTMMNFSVIDESDEKHQAFVQDEIVFNEYLEYAVSNGAIDVTAFDIDEDYYTSEELYKALVDKIGADLAIDSEFQKLVIEDMLKHDKLSYRTVGLILYDQGTLDKEADSDYQKLVSATIGSYEFIQRKIKKLDITPAQLGIDPCSGSVVVSDVNTGEVLAMVSYPSYNNNYLTNSIDADYYAKLTNDKTTPLYNRATQQRTAPGSTFKMISSIAAVSENVITTSETITTRGIFEETSHPAKCWVYPASHGTLNIAGAIENSCNYFFYELGYRMGTGIDGEFSNNLGLEKLSKYATMFGLDRTSGIELTESEPRISDSDAIRSAIGQGTHNYTATQLSRYVSTLANSGTCYDLTLVKEGKDLDGKVVYQNNSNASSTVNISNNLWNTVHDGMRRVVSEHTSSAALINRLKVNIAGKTGTAQENKNRPNHALFVSYAPYENPEVSVTVQIPFGFASGNAQELASFIYAYMYEPEILENETIKGNASVSD